MLHSASKPKPAPGPSGLRLLGSLPEIRRDPMGFGRHLVETYGDVVRFKLGPITAVGTDHPDHFKHVLQANAANYIKSYAYRKMKPLLGDGLITAEGEAWRNRRRLVNPAFHRKAVASFMADMVECGEAMVERWDAAARSGDVIDLHEEVVRTTLSIICRTVLGTDISREAGTVGDALGVFMNEAEKRILSVMHWPDWVPTPRNRRFKNALTELDDVVHKIIREHHEEGAGRVDLLGMLMTKDEEGNPTLTDGQLRDEIMTIFIAGHETSANAITWATYAFAQHPEVAEGLRAEIDSTLSGRAPTLEDIPKLTYLDQAFNEALRLYPPVWITSREALDEDRLGEYRVPKGATVVLPFFFLHRRPDYWPEPERFDPERFTPAACDARPSGVFLPFGAGNRSCIGGTFATLESKVLLAQMLQRYEIEVADSSQVEMVPTLTLRPKRGLPVRLKRRQPC